VKTQSILRHLLIHTCDITQATHTSGSSGSYGHDDEDYTTSEEIAGNVPCLLQAMSVREMVQLGFSGTIVGMYSLYMLPDRMPESLSMSQGSTDHQISNIRTKRGNKLVDAGPFNIQSVIDEAGQGHHFRLMLQRVS
jgi:hypothetical protein